MAIQVKGTLKDAVTDLLGGKNPTERRVQALLEELAQRRAKDGEPLPPVGPDEDEEDDEPIERPDLVAGPAEALDPQAEIERQIERSDPPQVHAAPPLAGAFTLSPVEKLLLEKLEALSGELKDLKAGALSPEEIEAKAIKEGKLPAVPVQAPPIGLTGLHDLPIGKWVTSPLGPKVPYMICGCGRCTPYRLHHYYCVVCKKGPYHYQQRYPHFKKDWMAPGAVWGISHCCCSEQCRLQYLSSIGVVAGVNDHEPLRSAVNDTVPLLPGEDRPEPTRIAVAPGSD